MIESTIIFAALMICVCMIGLLIAITKAIDYFVDALTKIVTGIAYLRDEIELIRFYIEDYTEEEDEV